MYTTIVDTTVAARRTTDIQVSQKLTLSKLRWAKNMVLYYFTINDLVFNMIFWYISKLVLNIVKKSILSMFDNDLAKNVASRA